MENEELNEFDDKDESYIYSPDKDTFLDLNEQVHQLSGIDKEYFRDGKLY